MIRAHIITAITVPAGTYLALTVIKLFRDAIQMGAY